MALAVGPADGLSENGPGDALADDDVVQVPKPEVATVSHVGSAGIVSAKGTAKKSKGRGVSTGPESMKLRESACARKLKAYHVVRLHVSN